ncbi:FMN-binding protein [Parashewanella spongiae]|uniref:FMN-binding protein n=1 Tax=Parashewanella spongiae TaxID=342950 RepID=A0A3A6U373_9GAMM|nr:FMN-binding protein [Parashewanella spongiae]MCL1076698.1 FMN-binding protein [Parashewanella spongiae]RJY18506.1 FMN-binding protein [Parashewanella spongiae]
MKKIQLLIFCFSLSLCISPLSLAKEYLSSKDFISQSFNGEPSQRKVYWLEDDTKKTIESILGHRFKKLRLRYWQHKQQTVWILNEIGKESPITIGIHIRDNKIVRTKVLVYRESRGDEVRHDFFTNQFVNAELTDELKLSKHIDGISGATLSVNALTKVSRIALMLHKEVLSE